MWIMFNSKVSCWVRLSPVSVICNSDICINGEEFKLAHYSDIIMGAMASKITSLNTVYSTVYSGADQRKHQISAPLAFVRGIHRWPMNSPHKGPITRKIFPFYDVIMIRYIIGMNYMKNSVRRTPLLKRHVWYVICTCHFYKYIELK